MQTRSPLYPGALLSVFCLVLAALLARLPTPAVAATAPCKQAVADAAAGSRIWLLSQGGIHTPADKNPGCVQAAKLWVADWIGPAVGSPVVPFGGQANRIEDLFAELHGLLWVDGVVYRVSDGVFKGLQGARAWVAVRPHARNASALGLQVVLFELNGHIYYAGLQKAT
jgi:hypothetical protein